MNQTVSNALVANNLPIPSALGSLDAYIGAVHQIPVLTVDEEQDLARACVMTMTWMPPANWCIRTCASWSMWPVATTAMACRWVT
jgi:DNA-directed RNA polymerase, sigma subunit (sigma70/sigma32)